MKLTAIITSLAITSTLITPMLVKANNSELTGDTKLACEAILCLSSGTKPNECSPGISRYFGITHRKWSDTVNARRDFLNMCPRGQDDKPVDPALVENIVQGAGRCDAAYLNNTLARQVEKQVCPTSWVSSNDDNGCYIKIVTIIGNSKPAYCSAFANSDYTYLLGVTYVGDPIDGGRWVNDSSGVGK